MWMFFHQLAMYPAPFPGRFACPSVEMLFRRPRTSIAKQKRSAPIHRNMGQRHILGPVMKLINILCLSRAASSPHKTPYIPCPSSLLQSLSAGQLDRKGPSECLAISSGCELAHPEPEDQFPRIPESVGHLFQTLKVL